MDKTVAFNQYKDMINSIIWKKYSYRANNDYDDMMQIGSEALLNALDNYDSGKGNISTYLYNAIDNKLKSLDVEIDNVGSSKCSKSVAMRRYITSNKELDFDTLYKKCPFKCEKQEFLNVWKRSSACSLDEVLESDMVDKANSMIKDNGVNIENDFESKESYEVLIDKINYILKDYNPRHKEIYLSWLQGKVDGKNITYQVLADRFGISKERVRQILSRMNEIVGSKIMKMKG